MVGEGVSRRTVGTGGRGRGLTAGWLRKNGVPYSERAVLTVVLFRADLAGLLPGLILGEIRLPETLGTAAP